MALEQIVRGYFGLGDHQQVVHVTSTADFLLHIWARNVDSSLGGLQVLTPPGQFRGSGSSGEHDGLVIDVPAQTGLNLGGIGGKAGETISLSSAGNRLVRVFLTVLTGEAATVVMTWS